MATLLSAIKLALRITTNEFDTELTNLVNACLADLGFAGVDTETIGAEYLSNPSVVMACTTYCKLYFGKITNNMDFFRLKNAYDEQKAQMSMATGYTDWEVAEGDE